jgi:ubiquinone biosynthesis monooxygenase Coq7
MFDGACPLCRREVDLYRSLDALEPVDWVDVSKVAPPGAPGQAPLLARFHVRQANGQWISGAQAFVALWQVLPGWRWLGWLARLPGFTPALEVMYRMFLRFRPAMQRAMRAWESRT